jgi:hypothetical protein
LSGANFRCNWYLDRSWCFIDWRWTLYRRW